MAAQSINNVITASFLRDKFGLSGSSGGSAAAFGAIGKMPLGSSNAAVQKDISALRLGARIYTNSLSRLNQLSEFVNLSRNTLEQLSEITDELIKLAEKATRLRQNSGRANVLQRNFKKLAGRYLELVKEAKKDDVEFLRAGGLEKVFTAAGMAPEKAKNIAEIFESFILVPLDDLLADDAIKNPRKVRIPPSRFEATEMGEATRTMAKISSNNPFAGGLSVSQVSENSSEAPGTDLTQVSSNDPYGVADDTLTQISANNEAANQVGKNGFITSNSSIYEMDDSSTSTDYQYIKTLDGTTVNLNSTTAFTVKAVNSTSGYSVIESTEDFLGHNTNGYTQLYIVDDTGNVIHQVTDTTAANTAYKDVAISADNKHVVYIEQSDYSWNDIETQSSAAILFGNGDGSFDAANLFAAGSLGSSQSWGTIAVGNINGAGGLDIVMKGYDSGKVVSLLGNTDGTFSSYSEWGSASSGNVILQDVNQDTYLDMLTTNSTTGQVEVFLGNGNGTFDLPSCYDVGSWAYPLELVDLNGDSIDDLVVGRFTSGGNNRIYVLFGNNDGSFNAATSFAAGVNRAALAFEDFNGDTHLDIATVGAGSGAPLILFGNGDGTFNEPITLPSGGTQGGGGVALGDLNGDTFTDVVLPGWIYYGNGDGTFNDRVSTGTEGNYFVKLSDLNGDGNLDLITDGNGTGARVSLGNGDGTFDAYRQFFDGSAGGAALADFNGDGELDLALWTTQNIEVPQSELRDNLISVSIDTLGGFNAQTRTNRLGQRTLNSLSNLAISDDASHVALIDGSGTRLYETNWSGSWSQESLGSSVKKLSFIDNDTVVVARDTDSNLTADTISLLTWGGSFIDLLTGLNVDKITALQGDDNRTGYFAYSSAAAGDENDIYIRSDDGTLVGSYNSAGAADTITTLSMAYSTNNTIDLGIFGVLTNEGDNDAELYRMKALSGTTGKAGFISGTKNVWETDDSSNNTDYVYINSVDGATVDLNSVTSFSLKTVNSVSGYSVIESSEDILGHNAGGYRQLFIVDDSGAVVHQATNNDDQNVSYSEVSISDDHLTLGYVVKNAAREDWSEPFWSGTTFTTGDQPMGLTSGDLDGDGYHDLVVANYNDHTLSLLLGNGDGTFKAPVSIEAGNFPSSTALADLDGDGELDLVVSGMLESRLRIFLGNGDGTFAAPTTFVANNSWGITLADIDGDNELDVVTTRANLGGVGVYFGNGDGTFDLAITSSGFGWSTSVQAGYVDGNQHLDLISGVSFGGDKVTLYLGNGDGTFSHSALTVGSEPVFATFADVDGDGNLDVVSADYGSDQISILLGNGDGTFDTPITVAAGSGPVSVSLSDINGDGYLDMISSDSLAGGNFGVYFGNGDGTFQARISMAAVDVMGETLLVDVNGDGVSDLVVAGHAPPAIAGNAISVYLGKSPLIDEFMTTEIATLGTFATQTITSRMTGESNTLSNVAVSADGSYLAIQNDSATYLYDTATWTADAFLEADDTVKKLAFIDDNVLALARDTDSNLTADTVSLYTAGAGSFSDIASGLNIDKFTALQRGADNIGYIAYSSAAAGDLNDVYVIKEDGSAITSYDSAGAADTIVNLSMAYGPNDTVDLGIFGILTNEGDNDLELYRMTALGETVGQTGFISTSKSIWETDSTADNKDYIYINSVGGGTVNLNSLTSFSLKMVNEDSGYSVIESAEDILGRNATLKLQLYLVDAAGNVVHQVTNNAADDLTYSHVDLSADNLNLVYVERDSAGSEDRLISTEIAVLGEYGTQTTTLQATDALDSMSNLAVSNDYSYAAVQIGANTYLYDTATWTEDATLAVDDTIKKLGFIDNNILVVARDSDANSTVDTVSLYTAGAGSFSDIVTGVEIDKFAALQTGGTEGVGFFVFSSAAAGDLNDIYLYKEDGTLVDSYESAGAADTISRLSLAFGESGLADIGVFGILTQEGDDDLELYRFNGIAGTTGQIGFISSSKNIWETDSPSEGTDYVYINSVGGGTADLSSVTSFSLKTVQHSSGYSVIESTEDLLGRNATLKNQLFIVDAAGTVVHQVTDNLADDISYSAVGISLNNLNLAYIERDSAGSEDRLVTAEIVTLGEYVSQTTTVQATVALDALSNLAVSDDFSYVAVQNGTNTYLYDTASWTEDATLAADSTIKKLGFIDSNQLAVGRDTDSNGTIDTVSLYTDGAGSFTDLLAGLDIGQFATLEKGDNDHGYFSFSSNAAGDLNDIYLYDDSGTEIAVHDAGAGDSISNLSLAENEDGEIDLGIFGILTGVDGDSNNQLYRLTATAAPEAVSYDRRYPTKIAKRIFDGTYQLTNFADSFRVLNDLYALKEQIDNNLKYLEEAQRIISGTMSLVFTTSLTMSNIADTLRSPTAASTVAQQIVASVRANAKNGLPYASNLEALTAYALLKG